MSTAHHFSPWPAVSKQLECCLQGNLRRLQEGAQLTFPFPSPPPSPLGASADVTLQTPLCELLRGCLMALGDNPHAALASLEAVTTFSTSQENAHRKHLIYSRLLLFSATPGRCIPVTHPAPRCLSRFQSSILPPTKWPGFTNELPRRSWPLRRLMPPRSIRHHTPVAVPLACRYRGSGHFCPADSRDADHGCCVPLFVSAPQGLAMRRHGNCQTGRVRSSSRQMPSQWSCGRSTGACRISVPGCASQRQKRT